MHISLVAMQVHSSINNKKNSFHFPPSLTAFIVIFSQSLEVEPLEILQC